jgi:hypothetical protein
MRAVRKEAEEIHTRAGFLIKNTGRLLHTKSHMPNRRRRG